MLLGIVNSLLNMNTSQVNPTLQKKLTYFNFLPKELREYCIQFVEFKDRETDEELRRRIAHDQTVPTCYLDNLKKLVPQFKIQGALRKYNPNYTKIVFIEKNKISNNHRLVAIYNISTNSVVHQKKLNTKASLAAIALSECGSQFATLEEDGCWLTDSKSILKIYDSNKGFIPDQYLPTFPTYYIKSIDFNKQKTQLILSRSDIPYSTISLVSEIEHREKSKKEFDAFFKQRDISTQLVQATDATSATCCIIG